MADEIVKSKPVPQKILRNTEEIVIQPDKRKEILNALHLES